MKMRIKDFSSVSSGSTPLRSKHKDFYAYGTIPWVKTMDLNNSMITITDERITTSAAKLCKPYPIDTILVAMYGGFNQIGRTGLLKIPASINQALSAISVNKSQCYPEFLLHYLNLYKNME